MFEPEEQEDGIDKYFIVFMLVVESTNFVRSGELITFLSPFSSASLSGEKS